jgi:hypothetical protein
MYIIKTTSKSKKDTNKKYYTFRLMESVRVGGKVKKITLLNLGSNFNVDQKDWADLSKRIDDIINKTPALFEIDKDLETLAQQYAFAVITAKGRVNTQEVVDIKEEDRYKQIDVTTIKNMNSKDIGVEHIVYETIKKLKLDTKLKELDFTNVQINSAIGTLVSKITSPTSDIGSYRWLCNTSGINELLDCDFNKISSNNIYRVADKLFDNKDNLEDHLYTTQKKIFDYDETITLYDLTNTYFEGGAKGVEKAKRGRSKEKRSDAPLITLGVMLDSSGFVRRSEIFDGNIGEATTFQGMLDKLAVPKKDTDLFSKKSLVIMDAGIASQENIDYLVKNEYRYIVVSRKKDKEFNEEKAVSVKLDNKDNVIVRAVKVVNEETKEIELFVHSKAKELKEKSMQTRVQKIFIEKLQYLKDGLPLKRRTKEYVKVVESIGRLKEKHSSLAQYYNILVKKDPNGVNAIDITWDEKQSLDKKSALNGVYCLRSNCTDLDEKTMWKTYTTLTDLEAVFKSLKSELGLRPIFHQKQSRVDGHLFITLLAYSIVHTIRYKLKQNNIHYSWDTIKDILSTTHRVTTSMKCKDGKTLYIRQSEELTNIQKEIYDVLNIRYRAGEITRVYI